MAGTNTMQQSVEVTVEGLDPGQIKAIQLADGWHNVSNCELIQFAVGKSRSPINAAKLYPTLRYENQNGQTVYTGLGQVLSVSPEQAQQGLAFSRQSGTGTFGSNS